ncbi:solute carrier family 17 member 9-like [Boleophthalmus pectinirostris]|uniref:solute carrier family 17 member 9-like n=1 Tax=Boleophthalmus pectinirostris TaxID=150288 RepID=UPI000A1C213B|nr:solute carrier family 17 member 9-like [Boleophthalmus pectinirostris]
MAVISAQNEHNNGFNYFLLESGNLKSKPSQEGQTLWPRSLARKWFVVLFLGTCLLYCARMAMPICAVTLASTFHWTKIDTGVVLGGFFWGYCITQILGGYVSDKIGGERVLLMSAASWGLITAGTPLVTRFSSHALFLMTAARFLMGLLQGVFFPSLASLCSHRVVKAERGFLMSILHSGTYLGTLVAGGLGSVMLQNYGWEYLFYCTGFVSGLWAFLIWYFLVKGRELPKQKQRANGPHQSKTRWLSFIKKSSVWSMMIAHTCAASTFYTLLSWLPTYFEESFPNAKGGVYNTVPWIAAIPASLFGGYASDFLITKGYPVVYVRKFMQAIAMGIPVLFILPMSNTITLSTAVTLTTVAIAATTFTSGGVAVNVQDLTPSCAGALYGFMNMMGALSGVVTVSLSGYLIEVTQTWATVFSLVALINLSGLGVYLIFGDAQRLDQHSYSPVTVI